MVRSGAALCAGKTDAASTKASKHRVHVGEPGAGGQQDRREERDRGRARRGESHQDAGLASPELLKHFHS